MFGLDLPRAREQTADQFREAVSGILQCRHPDCETPAIADTSYEWCGWHAFDHIDGEDGGDEQ